MEHAFLASGAGVLTFRSTDGYFTDLGKDQNFSHMSSDIPSPKQWIARMRPARNQIHVRRHSVVDDFAPGLRAGEAWRIRVSVHGSRPRSGEPPSKPVVDSAGVCPTVPAVVVVVPRFTLPPGTPPGPNMPRFGPDCGLCGNPDFRYARSVQGFRTGSADPQTGRRRPGHPQSRPRACPRPPSVPARARRGTARPHTDSAP